MPFHIDWHIQHRVIYAHATGHMKDEDFDYYSATVAQLLTEAQTHAPHVKQYIVLDTLEALNYPPTYLMIKRALPILRFKNRGPMFLVTQSRLIRGLVELTAHVSNFPLRVFNDRDEAIRAVEVAVQQDEIHIIQ